ncbi:uncharacterized protein LOC107796643 isoform X2 [Nicotiana tabacum]|uniref:Uncharacterized protein LOC107796643 isoform X2 n=1 Tax=Nicotiana tabacum TaxID=4097 RepID=A0A1S4AE62_TOBAC|nr:PREDICTED: uncharacterized protein LOC107796643 isoform X2 [Nicotiana tabacum]
MTQPNDKPPQDPPDLSKPAPSEKATTNLKPIPTSTRSLNPPTTTPKFLLITKSGNPKFMKEVEKSTSSQLEVHLENNNSDDDSKTPEQETSGQSKMEDEVPNSQEAKTNHNSKSSVQNFPKVSSNFDKINHNKKANASEAPNRNEQMGANPTRPASNQCQSEISMNPHGVGIRIPTTTMNRQNNPGTSKPSLTAAVQAKLAIGNSGTELPKAFTHTCLVLILKVECPQQFSELRPISLSNFTCKIISKLLNQRLAPLMQKMIFPNQTGFIKREINQ